MENAKKYSYDYNKINKRHAKMVRLAKENDRKIKRRNRILKTSYTLALYLSCIILVFCLSYTLIERNSLIAKAKMESMHLDNEIKNKKLEIENLESSISRNLDLNMIEKKAITDLKMAYPELSQTVYIRKKWEYKLKEDNNVVNSISKNDEE